MLQFTFWQGMLPLQIEKSVRTEQLFHPIDNALTPRILNSACFSLSAVHSPTIQEFCVFSRNVKQESLNKQLKCGSDPDDQMSTGEGAETRSVSSKLKWVALACWGEARWHGGGFFVAKNQGSRLLHYHGWQNRSKDQGQGHRRRPSYPNKHGFCKFDQILNHPVRSGQLKRVSIFM